jgi:hypothetical protein
MKSICNPIPSTVVCVAVALSAGPAASTDPTPTPTPRPRTLSDFARSTVLVRVPSASEGGIVITGDNLDELGRDASLSVAGAPGPEPPGRADPVDGVDPKLRQRWRQKVLAQSSRIAALEAKRAAAEAAIDRLERGRLDARALDRIEKAEGRLAMIDADLRRAKRELSRIVREARKQGAQPGWFR